MTLERGRIAWADFNPQRGREQAGRRPALVVSPSFYNAVSSCILACPITSNISPWPWKVILPAGEKITGAVLVDQLKSIDAKARNVEDTGQSVPSDVMEEILARLATLTE